MSALAGSTGFSIGAVLRAVWPVNTAKHAARAAGKSHRTCEDWLADRFCPSAKTLFAMADADDRLKAELVSILTKGLPKHVSPLDEEPVASNCNQQPMGGREGGPARRMGAR